MTVEEIEIIVTAKVEEALKEFNKIVPSVQKKMKEVQESFSKVGTQEMKSKMQNAIEFVKRKIQDLKKSSENNDISIKINNKDAEKQISQTQKQIDSLNKKINARKLKLDFVKQSANQMYINNNNNDGVKDNLGENAQYIKLCKQEKALNNEIQVYNKLLEDAKVKMVQLKQETSQAAIAQNKLSNFKINDKDVKRQIAQIQKQIDDLQEKISAKQLKLDFSRQSASQMYINNKNDDGSVKENLGENTRYIKLCEQEKALNSEIQIYNKLLESAKSKMAELKQQTLQTATSQGKLTSFFSGFKQKIDKVKPSILNMKNSFKGLPKITQNITNNIKGMGTGLKNGLGHVLKYAGALFSLRSIYSTLSGCARSWLSSQNAGAKQLSANIDYMKYAMGSALAPVIQFVTNLVYQLMKAIQSVAYALTGVNIFAKASASSYANMAGNAKKAKNETKQLAGIHNEINNISDNNSDSGSGGSTAPSFDLSGIDNTPNSIIDAIKNGNWYEVGATIGEKLNEAMNNIPWDKIQSTAKKIGTNIAQFLNGSITTTNWKQVGNTIAQGINTAIYFAQSFVHTFNWSSLGSAIANTINGFFKNTNWGALGDTISTGIKGALNGITTFFKDLDWSPIVQGLIDFCKNVDWNGVVDAIFEALGSACASLVNLGKVIGEKINEALELSGEFWQKEIEDCGGNIVQGILKGIIDQTLMIGEWIYDHIFKPFIEGFKNVFGIHSPSTVMEEQGNFIIEGLKNGLTGIWGKVAGIFEGFAENVKNKFHEIKNNISDTWENVKSKTKEKWEEIKGNVTDTWENIKGKAKEKFDEIKGKVTDTWNNIKNDPNKAGMATALSDTFSNIKEKAREKFDNIKTKITDSWNNIKNDKNLSNMSDTIKNTFSNLSSKSSDWGKDLVSNMASGIRNTAHKVGSAVQSVANKIKGFLGFSEPEEGPLSNFHTYMPDMIDLMVKGIKDNVGKVKSEIENLAGTMSYTINTEAVTGIPSTNPRIKPVNVKANNILDALSDIAYKGNENDKPIYLTVNVGNAKLGQILLDNLRDMKRQTGKDIEALVGG